MAHPASYLGYTRHGSVKLLQAMNHHAKDKVEIINAICVVYMTMLRPAGYEIINLRGGAGSWAIYSEADPDVIRWAEGVLK